MPGLGREREREREQSCARGVATRAPSCAIGFLGLPFIHSTKRPRPARPARHSRIAHTPTSAPRTTHTPHLNCSSCSSSTGRAGRGPSRRTRRPDPPHTFAARRPGPGTRRPGRPGSPSRRPGSRERRRRSRPAPAPRTVVAAAAAQHSRPPGAGRPWCSHPTTRVPPRRRRRRAWRLGQCRGSRRAGRRGERRLECVCGVERGAEEGWNEKRGGLTETAARLPPHLSFPGWGGGGSGLGGTGALICCPACAQRHSTGWRGRAKGTQGSESARATGRQRGGPPQGLVALFHIGGSLPSLAGRARHTLSSLQGELCMHTRLRSLHAPGYPGGAAIGVKYVLFYLQKKKREC